MDMNGDGRPDLLSGAYWYENPGPQGGTWKQHQYRTVGIISEFVSDSGEWAVDVNHDGALDVVTAGWMLNGLWWYENPKKPDVMWKKHFITDSYDTEGGWMGDINGDGKPDLVLAHYNHSGIIWVDFAGPEPVVHHVGDRTQDGHGTGIADVDGDGAADEAGEEDAIGVEELLDVDAVQDIDLESLASEESAEQLPDSPASESAPR